MVRVLLAQPRGFCAGVIRAIQIVDGALDRAGAPVYVRHEIVHNRHVVDGLKARGAIFVEELDEVPDGAVTVFSAHGVSREVQANAARRGLPVIDATCPLVSKVHAQGRRYVGSGRTLILIGHAGHPEVEGTLGQIDGPVHLVGSAAEVATLALPLDTPLAYITQTTLSVDDTKEVIAALEARFADVIGPSTSDICYATQNRQSAVRALCAQADLLLVVGSPNSSNSSRLREIGEEMGRPSYLVGDGNDIDRAWFDGIVTVGITAGASAPEELVQDVIRAIRQFVDVTVETLDGIEETMEFRLPPALKRLSPRPAADPKQAA
ncbi:MAG: 4-hydroxy-3-methylbut-2-enyl diphosphate reductase [Sphingomonadaceae bacterium]|nr:4-hydroxy-3-methylbut-2-enyl diphosphate reductase [Sphingomonadaceae bacterium]